ncbi:SMP-30/gluconolactonase/LRE family protein, partial [Nocardia cyriacigeorgica]|uniref:SMP-30/gluconolactonase/LRE family protein n=1 Tax=Nocardia cyriacigeorgica TaxID=135487 RepID=UPI002456F8AA
AGVCVARAPPAPHPAAPPPPAVPPPSAARVPLLDWSENVGFDAEGNLWVSRTFRNVVERYDRAGNLTATVPVTFPGAVRPGPDGLMYVNFGNITTSTIMKTGGVVRFDPTAANPVPEVYVDNIGMANGAAFDDDGYLYVTDTGGGIIRVRRDGSIDREWTAAAPQDFGLNGIVVHGDALYVTLLSSPTARLLRVPIADPAHPSVLTELSPKSNPPALPDDLTMAPDGMLYVSTATGRLARVDAATGATCTVATTQPITALAVSPGPDGTVFAGTESGDVLRIELNQGN